MAVNYIVLVVKTYQKTLAIRTSRINTEPKESAFDYKTLRLSVLCNYIQHQTNQSQASKNTKPIKDEAMQKQSDAKCQRVGRVNGLRPVNLVGDHAGARLRTS